MVRRKTNRPSRSRMEHRRQRPRTVYSHKVLLQKPETGARLAVSGDLPQNRERRGVVLSGRERFQIRDELSDILESGLLVLLEIHA